MGAEQKGGKGPLSRVTDAIKGIPAWALRSPKGEPTPVIPTELRTFTGFELAIVDLKVTNIEIAFGTYQFTHTDGTIVDAPTLEMKTHVMGQKMISHQERFRPSDIAEHERFVTAVDRMKRIKALGGVWATIKDPDVATRYEALSDFKIEERLARAAASGVTEPIPAK